jgi:hypothetical protein
MLGRDLMEPFPALFLNMESRNMILTAVNYNAWTLEFRQTGMMTVTLLPAVT